MDVIKRNIKKFILKVLPEKLLFQLKKFHYLHSIKSFSEDDIEIIKLIVKPGEYVVDIGANIGWYTKILSEMVGGNGRVFSIEPIPPTFALLSYCSKKLRLNNVELLNCAISENKGSIIMEVPSYETGGGNFYQAKIVENRKTINLSRRFSVEKESIDSLFYKLPNNISFIKCDVEGHELSVIRGANQLITKSKPSWLIEVSGNPDDKSSDSYLLFNHFEEKGYKAYWFDGKKLNRRSNGDKSINYFFLTCYHLKFLKMSGKIRS